MLAKLIELKIDDPSGRGGKIRVKLLLIEEKEDLLITLNDPTASAFRYESGLSENFNENEYEVLSKLDVSESLVDAALNSLAAQTTLKDELKILQIM